MPQLDGIAATRSIVRDPHLSEVRVLVLTMFDLDEYVFGALRAGASGFLLKDKGFEFIDEIKGGVVPQEYRPAVMKGIKETLEGGVIAGYPDNRVPDL